MIVDHPSAAPHTHCDVSSTVTQYNTVLLLCYCIMYMYIWEPAFEAGHGVEVFVNMGLQG